VIVPTAKGCSTIATSPPVVRLVSLKTAPKPGIEALSPPPGCTTVTTAPFVMVMGPPSENPTD
jgi:hypothetical protein